MRLLIIGGTRFLGRALVDAALAAGHEVTLFNRGQSNPGLYPDLEHLQGNRDGGLDVLKGRQWDVVIDTCGYIPRVVRASAEMLATAVDHYVFISTISVYADFSIIGIDEQSPVGTLADESVEEITGDTYGPLKVLCEQAVDVAMGMRSLHVRSGLIVGPHDPTDRFTYWPVRVARGGEVLAPGNPDQAIQFIDVRDIAQWTIKAAEQRLTGPYNVVGPAERLNMHTLLETCQTVSQSDARWTWCSDKFLLENEVAPFSELPLWVPAEMAGMEMVNCAKAMAAGLRIRPLTTTIRDTLNWHATRPSDHSWRAGLTAEREAELLDAWDKS
ncbi:MAG: epimerase [Ardenticatenaceae bacterium]|nr:epimerase [Ardenticatenaceae bacterium]MCB9444173.1 epimerase [Ardenticatenaceae bacterium]